jgi:hypothetical protein
MRFRTREEVRAFVKKRIDWRMDALRYKAQREHEQAEIGMMSFIRGVREGLGDELRFKLIRKRLGQPETKLQKGFVE